MTLDDDLRTVFRDAARAHTVPPPDTGGVIRGGRVRRRRRNAVRAGAGIAAVVVIAAGGWAALDPGTTGAPGPATPPSGRTTTPPPGDASPMPRGESVAREALPAGTYRVLVGTGPAGERIRADFTVDGETWSSGDFPLVAERYGTSFAGVGVYQPTALAAGNGCVGGATRDVGGSLRRLADQLAQLPRSTVLEGPAATEVLGRPAYHLQLQVDVACPDFYRVAETPAGERGISYAGAGEAHGDVVIDFWVLEVAGALVVLDQWNDVDASVDLVDQAGRARASIEILVEE